MTLDPSDDRHLLLCVRDNGVGLPPDLNFTDKSTLGLQLVSNLVGQLGGRLEAHPPEDGGAAVRVSFPMPGGTVLEDGA